MRYLTLSLLLFFTGLSYAGNYESLSFEEKQDYWGVSYRVSYSDGLWIKMACLPIVLESSLFVDGAEFIGLEVWQVINRGQDNTGVNKYFLKSDKSKEKSVTEGCFAPAALENMTFYFYYKGKGNIPLSGKVIAEASNKLLKENGRLQEGAL